MAVGTGVAVGTGATTVRLIVAVPAACWPSLTVKVPWFYRSKRCMRTWTHTLIQLGVTYEMPEIGDLVKHNAGDDCVVQVREMIACQRAFEDRQDDLQA